MTRTRRSTARGSTGRPSPRDGTTPTKSLARRLGSGRGRGPARGTRTQTLSHGVSDARSRRKCITYSFRKHGALLWRISSSLMRINLGKTKLKRFMDEKPLRSADRSVKKALCKKQSDITVVSDFEDTELRICEISGELMRRAYHDHDPFPSSALVAAVSIIPTSVKG